MRIRSCIPLAAALAVSPAAVAGQATAGEADRLEVIVAPYFLAPYMDGTLGINGLTATVSADPGDIFDKLQFGAMMVVEVRKGAWGGTVDGLYMNLEQAAERENVAATASGKQGAVDVSVFRTLLPTVDILLGARVNVLEGGLVIPATATDVSQSQTWVDPIVGLRLWAPTGASRWRLGIRADVGGFGIGSDLAYQIYPIVGFRASNLLSFHAAYRILDMKYESGDADFVYDMTTFGPQLGLALHF